MGVVAGFAIAGFALVRLTGYGGGMTIEPSAWRCDGSFRSWSFTVPPGVTDIRIDMHWGGVDGPVLMTDTQPLSVMAQYRQPDGSYRVVTNGTDAWECRQSPGLYAMVMIDPLTGSAFATGVFTMLP